MICDNVSLFVKGKITSPCKNCENRCVGCHSKCQSYQEYDKDRKQILKNIADKKNKNNDYFEMRNQGYHNSKIGNYNKKLYKEQ